MSDFIDYPYFDLGQSDAIVPSGVHFGVPLNYIPNTIQLGKPDWGSMQDATDLTISICNPMPKEKLCVVQVDEIAAFDSKSYRHGKRDSKLVRLRDVTDYGELLSNAAKWVQACGYDGIIVPLRGGVKPFIQINVLTEMRFKPCWLPFTQGANGVNEEQIRYYLKGQLNVWANKSPLKIAVVDTADSGDSSLMLASVCRSLRKEWKDKSRWAIDFILFFESQDGAKQCPPKSCRIPGMSTDNLVFRVFACGTPSLISEDWDEALGIRTIWKDGEPPEVITVPSKGRLLIQDYDGTLREFVADRLDQFTDQILGKEASNAVVTDPSLTFDRDVWQNYIGIAAPKGTAVDRGDTRHEK